MTFVGLTTAQLLAAAGVTTVLTVALYLLRLRRRTMEVPFSPLWQAVLSESRTTRLWSRLQHVGSLLLSLLLGALLLTAIGDPRFEDHDTISHTVVLVDTSPSMGATDVEASRLNDGLARLSTILERKRPAERFLIARMGDVTTPLTPMTDSLTTLRAALEGLAPGHTEADLPRALQFARDMLEGRPDSHVILVSDGALIAPQSGAQQGLPTHTSLQHVRVGQRGDNVAIESFAVRRYPLDPSRSEMLLELNNASASARTVELSLLADGTTIAVEPVDLAAGQRIRRVYDNVSSASERLEARIAVLEGPADPLAVDNRAFATVPPRRRARVLAVTDGNLYLQAALLLDEYLQVDVVAPAQFASGEGYDALVFDGVLPPQSPKQPTLYIHPDPSTGGVAPLTVTGRVDAPYFDRLRRDEPLLRWTALRDVNVATALRVEPQGDDVVVAGGEAGPLIVRGQREGVPFVALTFDVRRSDLPLRAAWPLLLLNVIESFRPDDAIDQPQGRVGDALSIAAAGDVKTRIVQPDGQALAMTATDGRASFTPTSPGFHTLQRGGARTALAVNLPTSLIADIAPTDVAGSGASDATRADLGPRPLAMPPWMALVLLATLLLAVEWWSYHRRWTL